MNIIKKFFKWLYDAPEYLPYSSKQIAKAELKGLGRIILYALAILLCIIFIDKFVGIVEEWTINRLYY